MKQCSKCGLEKPYAEFHRDRRTSDGLYSACAECHRLYVIAWKERNAWVSDKKVDAVKYEAYMKVYRRLPVEAKKQKARRLLCDAIRKGESKRLPCEACGKSTPKAQGHHDDYDKPLKVRWLCIRHHHDLHIDLRIHKRPTPSLVE